MADIDTDWTGKDRDKIKEFLFNFKGLYSADIITFNTIALKGAIRDVGRALEIPLSEVNQISSEVEVMEEYYRNKYPELFKYVDLLINTVVSVGTHPSGTLISPIPIDENMGLCTLTTSQYPVTVLNMSEIDGLNYVKLDLLGLDTVDVINSTVELAGIPRITPDNLDATDMNVWRSIRENTVGIFQMESETAQAYVKKLFSDETIQRIFEQNPTISLIDLFSFGNGAIRPSGNSFRYEASKGIFCDNGFKPLNDFMSDTLGYLCYQEQIMMFLVEFCGYDMAESDTVRRGIAKKKGTEQFIPEITRRFCETMKRKYNVSESKSLTIVEPFIQVILDSSDYGFSLNHSTPYSWKGFACGWLRYYYPLEFLTSLLNINNDNMDKTARVIEYANSKGIKIEPVKFRYSKSDYFFNKDTNSIYKGVGSVKYLNASIGEELYALRNNKYETFTDLLIEIAENTSLNSKQLVILITLGYFDEFGGNRKLLNIAEKFGARYKKNHKDKTKIARIAEINDFEEQALDLKLNIKEQIIAEVMYYGYVVSKMDVSEDYAFITGLDTKYSPRLTLYILKTGKTVNIKIKKKKFEDNPVEIFDIIHMVEKTMEFKWKKTDDGYEMSKEKELILKQWSIVK